MSMIFWLSADVFREIFYFHEEMFFQIFVAKGDTGQFFFEK